MNIDEIIQSLEAEKQDFQTKIYDIIQMSGYVSKLPETQVLMLSYRHQLIDKIRYYSIQSIKWNNKIALKRKERFEFYKTKNDVRLDWRETLEYVNADMRSTESVIDILKSQMEFYRECVQTLDKLGFSIKHRVEMERFSN